MAACGDMMLVINKLWLSELAQFGSKRHNPFCKNVCLERNICFSSSSAYFPNRIRVILMPFYAIENIVLTCSILDYNILHTFNQKLTSWPWQSSGLPAPLVWCWCFGQCWCYGRRAAWVGAWPSKPAWCSQSAWLPSPAYTPFLLCSGCWTIPACAYRSAAAAASHRKGSTLRR